VIAIDDLRKSYDGTPVLAGVTARFERGQVVAIVGPSGGGKSTLLRCINGLASFDGGSITVEADVLVPGGAHANARALHSIRQKVGFVFQQWNLFRPRRRAHAARRSWRRWASRTARTPTRTR
jgi:polar amino acid transport system ATP-binding protein